MSFKIVIDSGADLTPALKADVRVQKVPMTLVVDDAEIVDDESFDQADFLRRVAASKNCPRSACPSPEAYKKAFVTDAERVYCITIAGALSGSYNSALVGKRLYEEEYGKKDIFVLDSWSACCGECQEALRAMDLEEEFSGDFEKVCAKLQEYRDGLRTYFMLDNLETLRKNGRMSFVKAAVASTFKIKPVMSAHEGVIQHKANAVGTKKALSKLADMLLAATTDHVSKRLMITHVNNRERAEYTKELFLQRDSYRDVIIVDSGGIASLYANDGGIVVTL